MLKKRIIICLDVRDGKTTKGIKFKGNIDIGDPVEMAEKYYHTTARQAAQVARDAGVSRLILGHYSSRYTDERVLLNEALEVFPHAVLSSEMQVFDV